MHFEKRNNSKHWIKTPTEKHQDTALPNRLLITPEPLGGGTSDYSDDYLGHLLCFSSYLPTTRDLQNNSARNTPTTSGYGTTRNTLLDYLWLQNYSEHSGRRSWHTGAGAMGLSTTRPTSLTQLFTQALLPDYLLPRKNKP